MSEMTLIVPNDWVTEEKLVEINFIAKQMGHTDAQMVYRVYGSWMAENNQDQVIILNQKLSEFAPSMPHTVGSDGY